MILEAVSTVKTRQFRLFDDCLEIPVIPVIQDCCKVPAGPEFRTGVIRPFDAFKGRNMPAASTVDIVWHLLQFPLLNPLEIERVN